MEATFSDTETTESPFTALNFQRVNSSRLYRVISLSQLALNIRRWLSHSLSLSVLVRFLPASLLKSLVWSRVRKLKVLSVLLPMMYRVVQQKIKRSFQAAWWMFSCSSVTPLGLFLFQTTAASRLGRQREEATRSRDDATFFPAMRWPASRVKRFIISG